MKPMSCTVCDPCAWMPGSVLAGSLAKKVLPISMLSHIPGQVEMTQRSKDECWTQNNSSRLQFPGQAGQTKYLVSILVIILSQDCDPHWVQCGSGFFKPQFGSGSREPNQCGSGSFKDFAVTRKFNIYMKKYTLCKKQIIKHTCVGYKSFLEFRFIC